MELGKIRFLSFFRLSKIVFISKTTLQNLLLSDQSSAIVMQFFLHKELCTCFSSFTNEKSSFLENYSLFMKNTQPVLKLITQLKNKYEKLIRMRGSPPT